MRTFSAPSEALKLALEKAAVVLLALPEQVATDCLEHLKPAISPSALVVDTLSVKGEFVRAAQQKLSQELLSLNPMFRPELGFAGHPLVAVRERPAASGDQLLEWLKTLGAEAIPLELGPRDGSCNE